MYGVNVVRVYMSESQEYSPTSHVSMTVGLVHALIHNLTNLQLMTQWLQLIHSSLVTGAERRRLSPRSQALSGQNVPHYPRAMLRGTHWDHITTRKAKAVLQSLQSTCDEAAFGDLIVDKLLVDHTTAGIGKGQEDPENS